jgi:beta-xylosidase
MASSVQHSPSSIFSELTGVLRVLSFIINIGLLDRSRLKSVMFENAIISGFAPDPFVVLVNGISYLATSSFYLFPSIPI